MLEGEECDGTILNPAKNKFSWQKLTLPGETTSHIKTQEIYEANNITWACEAICFSLASVYLNSVDVD